jgi:hypothetical protein
VSGPNEHFLPRLIQRGFLLQGVGEFTFQVTSQMAGKRPIRKVGSADYFNSGSKSGKAIDDELGKFENKIGPTFEKWRNSSGEIVPAEVASETILRFAIRGSYIRENFIDLLGVGFERLLAPFMSEKTVRKKILKEITDEKSDTRLKIRKNLIQQGRLGQVLIESEKLCVDLMIEQINLTVTNNMAEFRKFFPILDDMMPYMMKKAHRNVLAVDLNDTTRSKKLLAMDWRIAKIKNSEFILPDCVAIVVPQSGPCGPLFLWERDVPHCVVMPISNENLLIGGQVSLIDPSTLNAQLASCATTFYISSSAEQSTGLSGLIGKKALQFQKRATAFVADTKR